MAPRTAQANEQIKDERRSQILISALRIFTKKGFAAAKMSDISNDAGISYGLIYHYFKSKDDIYMELIEHAIDSIGKMVKKTQMKVKEPYDQIRKIVFQVFSSVEHKEESGYYYVLIMNAITGEAKLISKDKIISESMEGLMIFSDIISQGQKKGQIREGNPKELVITCFSAAIGLALLKVSGTISKMPDPQILMRIFDLPENEIEGER